MERPHVSAWLLAAALFVASFTGCATPTSQSPEKDSAEGRDAELPADPKVLAVYDGGEITSEDVDRFVLSLPPEKRVLADKDRAAFFSQLVREMTIDRLLLREAEEGELASRPDIATALAEAKRQHALQVFLARRAATIEDITEEDLKNRFAEAEERFELPASRRAYHLFIRRRPGQSSEELTDQMAALRARLEAGESFRSLATEYSDSESRHRGGDLGVLKEGELPPQLERVIFSLPQGVPSAPVLTAEGVHLFLVDQAQSARRFAFEEVESLLYREELIERRSRLLERLASDLPPVGEVLRLEAEEIRPRLEAGDADAVLLRAGEFEETLSGALRRLAPQAQARPTVESIVALGDQLELRERIFALARSEGWFEEPDVAESWRRKRDGLLVERERALSLQKLLDSEPERLRTFYQDHASRFSTPLEVRLRVLRVPFSAMADVNAGMARLEALAKDRETSFEDVARELGGTVTDLDWLPFPALHQYLPSAAPLAADLPAGGRSAPFRVETQLAALEMLERREPEPRPFATVLEQVRAAYLERHGQTLYQHWSEAALAGAHWRIFESRIERFAEAGAEIAPASAPSAG